MAKKVAFNIDDESVAPPGAMPAADLSSIGASLVNEIPEPQQHAIDQATAENAAENGESVVGEVDALGVPWDAAVHATGADGKGIKTVKGAWRKRRGISGSPSQLNSGRTQSTTATAAAPEPTVQETHETQCRIAGAMMGTLMVRLSVGVGGSAFLPRILAIPGVKDGINEQDMLNSAWGDYFVSRGITDLPPSAALLGALSMYYLPRLQDQQVREKVGGVFGWFKDKITRAVVWWKYRKSGTPKQSRKVTPKEREGATDGQTRDADE